SRSVVKSMVFRIRLFGTIGARRILEAIFPSAAVDKLNVEMFAVKPESGNEHEDSAGAASPVFLRAGPNRLCPALADAVTEAEPRTVAQRQHCFREIVAYVEPVQSVAQQLFACHNSSGAWPRRFRRPGDRQRHKHPSFQTAIQVLLAA